MSHPTVKQTMTQPDRKPGDPKGQGFKRERGIAGVPSISVAGSGQNVSGHIRPVTPETGGYSFPLGTGLEIQFGQAI